MENIKIDVIDGITYLPHKAVAEVSKDKEPIGRECAEFNWFESQLMSDSIEVRFKWFGLSSDLKFKRFGCQWMCFKWFWLCVDLRFQWGGCQLIWDSSDLVVNQVEIQMIWLSIVLKFKWVGRQLMCDSNDFDCQLMWEAKDLEFECFEIQLSWLSTDVRFKWLWLWVDVRFKWFGFRRFWDSSK